jgi:hypothetical protein
MGVKVGRKGEANDSITIIKHRMTLKPDEIKYVAEQIKKTISSIEHTHFQWTMGDNYEYNKEEYEYPGWTEKWIRIRIRDLYHLILAYLEMREMPKFLETFKNKFQVIIEDDKIISEAKIFHPEGEPELIIINQFKQFLDPFKFFDYQQSREDETIKLISILKNTDFILKNSNAEVIGEADIYKQIKWVLGLYYPSCRLRNKASFIQEFKSYNPDILIPELKTAIEYKYIKSKSDNLDEFIDQIRIDASNYTDDYRYENFIAVIYIENASVATPENIEVAWKSKKFPNNWELVVVNGSPTKKERVKKEATKKNRVRVIKK